MRTRDRWDLGSFLLTLSIVLIVLTLFGTGPPAQAGPVQKYLGPTLNLMVPMFAEASFAPLVFTPGTASLLLVLTDMPMADRYMRTEIPVALPPARAVIARRAALRYHLVNDHSRGSPPLVVHRFNRIRVIRV